MRAYLAVALAGFTGVQMAWAGPSVTEAVLTGSVLGSSACFAEKMRGDAQVFVSVGQTLLYQVEVPQNGTFEFHVLPGKYEVVAATSKGCTERKEIQVAHTQTKDLQFSLSPGRKIASQSQNGAKK